MVSGPGAVRYLCPLLHDQRKGNQSSSSNTEHWDHSNHGHADTWAGSKHYPPQHRRRLYTRETDLCLLSSSDSQITTWRYCTLVLHWETAKQSVVRFRIGHICGFSCILPFSCMTPGTNINNTVHQTCDNHPIMQTVCCSLCMVHGVWCLNLSRHGSGVCWW